MAADRLGIDTSTIIDNPEERQVEFTAEVDSDEYEFAVRYAVLEALSGDPPEDDATDLFARFSDAIAEAGLVALGRNTDPPCETQSRWQLADIKPLVRGDAHAGRGAGAAGAGSEDVKLTFSRTVERRRAAAL
eukprot:gene11392-15238_t